MKCPVCDGKKEIPCPVGCGKDGKKGDCARCHGASVIACPKCAGKVLAK